MFFSGPQIIGCAARKIFSIHKILVMVFQYSHCQDTGTPDILLLLPHLVKAKRNIRHYTNKDEEASGAVV